MNLETLKKKIKRGIKKTFNREEKTELNYQEVKRKRREEGNTILLDVRSTQEFQEGHLEGAINIPVYELQQQVEKNIPNKFTSIIVYCQTGSRSNRALSILEKLGYTNVYELENGLDGINK